MAYWHEAFLSTPLVAYLLIRKDPLSLRPNQKHQGSTNMTIFLENPTLNKLFNKSIDACKRCRILAKALEILQVHKSLAMNYQLIEIYLKTLLLLLQSS